MKYILFLLLFIGLSVQGQAPTGSLNEPGRKYFPNGTVLTRLTTVEMLAISPTPNQGMEIYNKDSLKPCWYNGATWDCSSGGGGSSATGATGATGVTGPTGATGTIGITGITGITGAIGITGATGSNGSNGVTGATGSNGSTGVTGATGTNGTNGTTGATGSNGSNGTTGVTGVTGATGATGADGSSGSGGVNIWERYINDLGSSIFASTYGATFDRLSATVAPGTLADGQLSCALLFTPSTSYTMLGVKWFQGTQGNYTADNYNGAFLGTLSGGTITWVDSTANDGNIWKGTANTLQSKAFYTPYTLNANSTYVIAFMYNNSAQVALPTIYGLASQSTGAIGQADFANSVCFFATKPFTSNVTLGSTQAYSGLIRTTVSLPMFFAYK